MKRELRQVELFFMFYWRKDAVRILVVLLTALLILLAISSPWAYAQSGRPQDHGPGSDRPIGRQRLEPMPERDFALSRVPEGSLGQTAVITGTGSITGTVTAENGAIPLENIFVEVYQYNGSWEIVTSVPTDANGDYNAGGLPTGDFRIGFFDLNNRDYVTEYYDGVMNLDNATDIAVIDGSVTPGKNAALTAAGHISGTITAEIGGTPLDGIQVCPHYDNGFYWEWQGNNCVYTDSAGEYDVGGLAAGLYRLEFRDFNNIYISEYYDNAVFVETATDISVSAGITTPNIDASLAEAGHISGTITADDGGDLLPGIEVCPYKNNGFSWEWQGNCVYTDGAGQYDLGGLAAGLYRLNFVDYNSTYLSEFYDNASNLDNANDISVSAGNTTSGIDAALAAAGHITGTVTAEDSGDPLPNIYITAFRYNGNYWEYVSGGQTDSNGLYDISYLRTGTHRLEFSDGSGIYALEYYNNALDLNSATDINVTTGSTTPNINVALILNGQISGTVTDDDDGLPLQDITVQVLRFDGTFWNWVNEGFTDALGNYEVNSLPPGTYRVQYNDYVNNFYLSEYYDNALDIGDAADVIVTSGSTTSNIDAGLAEGGHISGTVTAEVGGTPLPDILACAFFFDDEHLQWDIFNCQSTAGDGTYQIDGLRTGDYRLKFIDGNEVYAFEYYNDALNLAGAADISITAGSTTSGIDAALVSGGSISGTVTTDAGGAPLQHIQVCARFDNGFFWESARCDTTDSNGDYTIGGLQTSPYRVRFRDDEDGNYAFEYYDDAPTSASAAAVAVTAGNATTGIDAALAEPTPPANNDFDNATQIQAAQITFNQSTEGATTAGDDPLLSCQPFNQGRTSVWFAITPDQTAMLTADTFGSDYDTILAVWQGTRGNLSSVACNGEATHDRGLQVIDVPLVGGTTYYIEVASRGGNGGELFLNINLSGGVSVTHNIPLLPGWNMISSYITPDDPTLESLLADIESNMVLMKNGAGEVYWPSLPVNDIGSWDERDGYQIYMLNADTLSITGQQIDPAQTPISLLAGWNTIAFLHDTSMPVEQALNNLGSNLTLAKNGSGEVYWPGFNVNQIGDMQPGEGYQVYLSAPASLTYP